MKTFGGNGALIATNGRGFFEKSRQSVATEVARVSAAASRSGEDYHMNATVMRSVNRAPLRTASTGCFAYDPLPSIAGWVCRSHKVEARFPSKSDLVCNASEGRTFSNRRFTSPPR
jgi:hypothetical protein